MKSAMADEDAAKTKWTWMDRWMMLKSQICFKLQHSSFDYGNLLVQKYAPQSILVGYRVGARSDQPEIRTSLFILPFGCWRAEPVSQLAD